MSLRNKLAALVAPLTGLVAVSVASAAILFGFDGAPSVPTPYSDPNLSITYTVIGHTDAPSQWGDPFVDSVQHGPNCEPPGRAGTVQHETALARDVVFQCANHVMTYGPTGGSAVRIVPNQALDLSSGEGTVDFDVSTLSLSSRDWLFVAVQDWSVQEAKITDQDIPSAKGNPRNTLMIEQGTTAGFSSDPGTWAVKYYDENRERVAYDYGASIDAAIGGRGARSAQVREHFQLVVNKNGHVKFWLPARNFVITETDVPPISWNLGVVSFVHNTYSPSKGWNPDTGNCDNPPEECGHPNTWHWDNFGVTPSVPFEIVKTDHRGSDNTSEDTFTFDRPLPADSLVRFEGWGDAIRVSFDGGPEVTPMWMSADNGHAEHSNSYLVPGVTGATRMHVRVTPTWCCSTVNNVEAFALGRTSPPTPTPEPTPSPTPSPTPAPAVCDITLRRNGVVEWTSPVVCP